MDKSEVLRKIYELVNEAFGDSTLVEICVNSSGIECRPTYTPFTVGHTMRTINGEWVERREDDA